MSAPSAPPARPARRLRPSRSATWRLATLVTRLDLHAQHREEVRRAVGPDGVREPHRLALALLGVLRLARRAGGDAAQARVLVQCLVHDALGASHEPRLVEQVALRCVRLAEALAARDGLSLGTRAGAR
jgi:hypothetical protein